MIPIVPVVEIHRMEGSPRDGTFGKMLISKRVFADTVEPFHRDNEPVISCINAGPYVCRRIVSPKFGETFEITDVQGRTHILFHWGNFDENTRGCVVMGNGIGVISKRRAVLNSRNTFGEFMKIMAPYNEFVLIISEHY